VKVESVDRRLQRLQQGWREELGESGQGDRANARLRVSPASAGSSP
jgi:hypothetical protein